jgi:hypothetical protein
MFVPVNRDEHVSFSFFICFWRIFQFRTCRAVNIKALSALTGSTKSVLRFSIVYKNTLGIVMKGGSVRVEESVSISDGHLYPCGVYRSFMHRTVSYMESTKELPY